MLPVGTNLEVTRPPKATIWLITINVAVFVLEETVSRGALRWILDNLDYKPGTIYPIGVITALFLHGNFFHLFGNMLYLWLFGGPVEERIGSRLFTYYYFGAGLWSTALYGLLEAITHSGKYVGLIGASGAISGIMALFLYRCYYGKIKMSVPVLPTFIFAPWIRFSLPAAPLLIYWFLRDFIGGITGGQDATGIAYWAHVGGFLFGLAVGRIRRYGHEGQLEQAKKKLLEKLQQGSGWKAGNAEKELLKLLKLSSRDPEIHHQLAHFYMENDQPKKAEEHYQRAVNQYFLTDPVAGAYAVIDHAESLKKPMGSNHHLKAAEVLIGKRHLEDAHKALWPVVEKGEGGAIAERAGMLFVKVCQGLDRSEEAAESAARFLSRHPATRHAADIRRSLTLKLDALFPPRKETPDPRKPQPLAEEDAGAFLHVLHGINRLITDPLFLLLWMFMLSWVGESKRTVIFTFSLAFFITAFYRIDWFHHWSQLGRRSEKEAAREFDAAANYNKAVMAEKASVTPRRRSCMKKRCPRTPQICRLASISPGFI